MFLEIEEKAFVDESLAVFLVGDEYFNVGGFGAVGRALEAVRSGGSDVHRSETLDDVFRAQIFLDAMNNYGQFRRDGTFRVAPFSTDKKGIMTMRIIREY